MKLRILEYTIHGEDVTIKWHCRGCDEQGVEEFKFDDLIKKRKGDENLIDLVMREIKHECSDKKLGVLVV